MKTLNNLTLIMMNRKLIFLLAIIALWSCGDDDEDDGGTLVDISEIQGLWVDRTLGNDTPEDGFVVVNFVNEPADGIITAFGENNQGYTCDQIIFRNIIPGVARSFVGEGWVVTGTVGEWVPVLIGVGDSGQISFEYEGCEGCDFIPDAMIVESNNDPTVPIILSTDIRSDLTLRDIVCDPSQPDYVVTDLIDVDALLTIEPGVIIEFTANSGLVVDEFGGGTLIAKGTAVNPITFTGQTKTRGFWRGLIFETNDVRNELDHVIVEYAGSDVIADDIKGGVRGGIAVNVEPGGEPASIKLTNSTIRENDGYGLIMEWFSQLRDFSNNSFEGNTDAAVLTEAINVGALDATTSYRGGNGFEGVEISETTAGNTLRDDATWTNFDDGSSYYVSGDIEIEATLTILAGATLEFEANTEIFFGVPFNRPEGILIANGTMLDPVTFTGVQKVAGFWKGIVIQSTSNQNLMSHCIVEYGGSDAILGGEPANISLDIFNFAPNLTLLNSTVRNSAGCGVYIQSSSSVLTQSANTFTDNPGGNVCD